MDKFFTEGEEPHDDPNYIHENLWEGWDELLSTRPEVKKSLSFRYADLSYADLSNRNWSNVDFSYANLTGANFTNANILGANFSYAKMSGANLSVANSSVSSEESGPVEPFAAS